MTVAGILISTTYCLERFTNHGSAVGLLSRTAAYYCADDIAGLMVTFIELATSIKQREKLIILQSMQVLLYLWRSSAVCKCAVGRGAERRNHRSVAGDEWEHGFATETIFSS